MTAPRQKHVSVIRSGLGRRNRKYYPDYRVLLPLATDHVLLPSRIGDRRYVAVPHGEIRLSSGADRIKGCTGTTGCTIQHGPAGVLVNVAFRGGRNGSIRNDWLRDCK